MTKTKVVGGVHNFSLTFKEYLLLGRYLISRVVLCQIEFYKMENLGESLNFLAYQILSCIIQPQELNIFVGVDTL